MDMALLAHLGGAKAMVLGEAGEFEEGEGLRVSLLPDFLLIQVQTEGMESHLLLNLVNVIDAMMKMNKEMGN